MLSAKLFNLLNELGKVIRGNRKPFGGIQVIFLGDFYQLPPVGSRDEPETQQFCFESSEWLEVFPLSCQVVLVKMYRQLDDIYADVLNQIRKGIIKKSAYNLMQTYVGRERDASLLVEPTKLFPTRNRVDHINQSKMLGLSGDSVDYTIQMMKDLEITKSQRAERMMMYSSEDIQREWDNLSANLLCEKEIKLKVGAQVMCIINIQTDWGGIVVCNGSQGIVVGFCEITKYPVVKYNNGVQMTMERHVWASDKIPGIGVSQVPLILAWALTIHKSQGATLDVAEIDVGSDVFECGQTYVALSRVKSLEGLYLTSFDASKIKIHAKVKKYYEMLEEEKKEKDL